MPIGSSKYNSKQEYIPVRYVPSTSVAIFERGVSAHRGRVFPAGVSAQEGVCTASRCVCPGGVRQGVSA